MKLRFVMGHLLASGGGFTSFIENNGSIRIYEDQAQALEQLDIVNNNIPVPVWDLFMLVPMTDMRNAC